MGKLEIEAVLDDFGFVEPVRGKRKEEKVKNVYDVVPYYDVKLMEKNIPPTKITLNKAFYPEENQK